MWAAVLQKARGKGWGESWVFENCFETSSGLLLVVGAPTTSKNEKDMVSAIYIPSFTVPCERSVQALPSPPSVVSFWLPWGWQGTRHRFSRLQLGKEMLRLTSKWLNTSSLQIGRSRPTIHQEVTFLAKQFVGLTGLTRETAASVGSWGSGGDIMGKHFKSNHSV